MVTGVMELKTEKYHVVVIECTEDYSDEVVQQECGPMYGIQSAILQNKDYGNSCDRKRKYIVMNLTFSTRVITSLEDFIHNFKVRLCIKASSFYVMPRDEVEIRLLSRADKQPIIWDRVGEGEALTWRHTLTEPQSILLMDPPMY